MFFFNNANFTAQMYSTKIKLEMSTNLLHQMPRIHQTGKRQMGGLLKSADEIQNDNNFINLMIQHGQPGRVNIVQ
jgi:hypothetical protein